MEEKKRHSFGGSIGFVLAAAGSAVGLGNIWRFPYLAAKDGGGLFLVVYIILALTFGYTLLTTEIAIGRKTKQSPLTAYTKLHDKWGFLGAIASIIPVIIMPYYCTIGGWVVKYFFVFLTGHGADAAQDGFFTGFITSQWEPIITFVIFLAVSAFIVFRGVNKGIESTSKIIMPILLVMILGIAIFSLTLKNTNDAGEVVTGLQGFKIYIVPNFEGLTIGKLFTVLIDALGQLFFSLSVAMGIMITYGSYVKDDANLGKSINQIEIFDTVVAFMRRKFTVSIRSREFLLKFFDIRFHITSADLDTSIRTDICHLRKFFLWNGICIRTKIIHGFDIDKCICVFLCFQNGLRIRQNMCWNITLFGFHIQCSIIIFQSIYYLVI